MLRSFRIANHKSFRDEAELLLLPVYDKARPVVSAAGILGANASGKSNLLDALHWLERAVRESYAGWDPGAGIPRTPFRLDREAAARPSLYCVEFVVAGSRFTYGVELDDERVVEEWLYTYPHSRRRVIFDRKGNEIRLGSTVPDYRARGEQLARQTRANALFLSVAAHNALSEAQPVYEWFRRNIDRFGAWRRLSEGGLKRLLSDESRRRSVVELVRAADFGISQLTVDDGTALEDTAAQMMEIYRRVNSAMIEQGTSLDDHSDEMEELLRLAGEVTEIEAAAQVRFHHGGSGETLTLEEQSAGTRNWIDLVMLALDTLDRGGLLVIDEIDASLHPHLSSRLIAMFHDRETNRTGAQLLFTTHDVTLLDEETLARDEVWFVEKEPDSGASRLYPLTDFHPRRSENVKGRYLAGAYGAVPIPADPRSRRRVVEAGDAAA